MSARTAESVQSLPRSQDDIMLPMLDPDQKMSPSDSPSPPPPDEIHSAPAVDKERFAGAKRVLAFCIEHWEKAFLLAILITLIVLVSVKGFTVFGDILKWFQRRNNWAGWAVFLAMYTVNVSLLLPGIVLILGAGFVFGFWKGLLAVWIGGGVGQSMAFLLARYLIGDLVSMLLRGKSSRKWEMVDRAIEMEGWKLLLLCRMCPLIPYNLLNVAMASTKIHFWPFAIVSFFGIIPECALFTYTGSMTEDLSTIVTGEAHGHGKVTYILGGISAFFLVLTACWATFIIRRALKRADASLKEDSALEAEIMEAGGDPSQSPQEVMQTPEAASDGRGWYAQQNGWLYRPPSGGASARTDSRELQEGHEMPHSPGSDASDPWAEGDEEELRLWTPQISRKEERRRQGEEQSDKGG